MVMVAALPRQLNCTTKYALLAVLEAHRVAGARAGIADGRLELHDLSVLGSAMFIMVSPSYGLPASTTNGLTVLALPL